MSSTASSESLRTPSQPLPQATVDADHPASVFSCAALITGTTIGAGILALPAVTLPSGILPSTLMLLAVWLYALISGLLIAEAQLNSGHSTGQTQGLLAVVEHTLGIWGVRLAAGAYLFLHYALLVAYMAQGGEILVAAVQQLGFLPGALPRWIAPVLFTLLFGSLLYFGRSRLINRLNTVFVAIVLVSFAGLLAVGLTQIKTENFFLQNWQALSPAIPVMLVALFYHNIIPVVTVQLEGNRSQIRQAIVLGSVIPLILFLVWNMVILAAVHPNAVPVMQDVGFDPLQWLRQGQAGQGLSVLVSVFSEFAIVTSFIGFVYGLSALFQEMLSRLPHVTAPRWQLYSLVLLPPMGVAALNPGLFLTLMDYVGTFSVSVLGGLLPAIMTWKQRTQKLLLGDGPQPLVPGGQVTLMGTIAVALAVIVEHVLSLLPL